MIRYLKGFLSNLFNPAVSLLMFIDGRSEVDRRGKVNRFAKIVNSSVGRYSYVGVRSWVVHTKVGSFCSIANDVNIGLAKHSLEYLSTSPIFTEKRNGTGHSWVDKSCFEPSEQTVIGNDVWIGFRAIIRGGIRIGNGAVIGAGAVVTKDVPAYAIVGGVPAKVIRYRYPQDVVERLEKVKWWEMEESVLRRNLSMFQHSISEEDINMLNKLKRGGVKLLSCNRYSYQGRRAA